MPLKVESPITCHLFLGELVFNFLICGEDWAAPVISGCSFSALGVASLVCRTIKWCWVVMLSWVGISGFEKSPFLLLVPFPFNCGFFRLFHHYFPIPYVNAFSLFHECQWMNFWPLLKGTVFSSTIRAWNNCPAPSELP